MTTKTQEYFDEYKRHMGRVQSGILAKMMRWPSFNDMCCNPKHIRVGIDSAMVSDRAMFDLLVAKGVFTEEEYAKALRDSAKREADTHEKELGFKLGEAGII